MSSVIRYKKAPVNKIDVTRHRSAKR